MKHEGFLYSGDYFGDTCRVYYIDSKGKDISFNRWRFCLYYTDNTAATHFTYSEESAAAFMDTHKAQVYDDYDAFRTDYNDYGLQRLCAARRAL